ncbi:spondin-2-like isoform X1 [Vanessa tameamea]|uniref:Spondin-2-like isoform X1 n=1 Tax=Vanessa tameamea TaxID=334116 RepID=A0A8B8HI85_VANTA|nr:spondin-2-like isoform X1 [Vanessa tameamea]
MKALFRLKVTHQLLYLIYLIMVLQCCHCEVKPCDRRPLETKTDPLPPDNRFQIEIIEINDNMYIPNRLYTVRLFASDDMSTFIAFTISALEDTKPNEKNRRKPIPLNAGIIYAPLNSTDSKLSLICNNSVIQTDITPKLSVQVKWRAPPKDNKCVTIYALIAVKPDVWYSFDGPLSKKVCEDRRNMEDIQPMENDNCTSCEDARYLLTFEGIWSYNTHRHMFPNASELARFSDVVGASHSKNYQIYKFNTEASGGLKMLVEQGNTTKLEMEIQAELGSSVRTIIKALGQPKPNMVTNAIFRVTREHHLVSLVTAIIPSPDWFLGVSNMELCEVTTRKWAPNLTFNLYPLDAGTDSGLTFESPNEDTMPPQSIKSAEINKLIPKEQMKPFAKLHFELMRTYTTPDCTNESPDQENKDEERQTDSNEIPPPTTPSREEPSPDIESTEDCPMTAWEEWLSCEGECINGKLKGYQTRFRYHLVDGVAVGKYNENNPSYEEKRIPQYCVDNYLDIETKNCEETCEEEEEVSANRRIW